MTALDTAPTDPETAGRTVPAPLPPGPGIEIPETTRYRMKRKVLGPPLHTDQLEHERLG